jgi:hypothetical protein
MKKIPESQFNSLTNKRMNTIGGTMKDIVKTAENNPEHLTDAVENVMGALEAVMEQPTYEEIGEFKLPGGSASASTGGTRKKSLRGNKASKLFEKLAAAKKVGEPIDPEDYDLLPRGMQKELDAVELAMPAGTVKIEAEPEPEVDDADVEAAAIDAEDEETALAPAKTENDTDSADDDFSDDDLEALLSGDDLDDAA